MGNPIQKRQPNWKKIRHQYETQDISLRVLAHRWGFSSKNSIVRRMDKDRAAGDPWIRNEQMIAARIATDQVLAMEEAAMKGPPNPRIGKIGSKRRGPPPIPDDEVIRRPKMPPKSERKPGRPKKTPEIDPSNITSKDARKGPIDNSDLRTQVDRSLNGHVRDQSQADLASDPEPKPENSLHGALAIARNQQEFQQSENPTVRQSDDSEAKRHKRAERAHSDVNEGSAELQSARRIANAHGKQIKKELEAADHLIDLATVVLQSAHLAMTIEVEDDKAIAMHPAVIPLRRFNALSVKEESLSAILKNLGAMLKLGVELKRRALGMDIGKGAKGSMQLPGPEAVVPSDVRRMMDGLDVKTLKDLSRAAGEAQRIRREAQVRASTEAAEAPTIDEEGREV